jgi:hypothetical protein
MFDVTFEDGLCISVLRNKGAFIEELEFETDEFSKKFEFSQSRRIFFVTPTHSMQDMRLFLCPSDICRVILTTCS